MIENTAENMQTDQHLTKSNISWEVALLQDKEKRIFGVVINTELIRYWAFNINKTE